MLGDFTKLRSDNVPVRYIRIKKKLIENNIEKNIMK